MTNNISTKNKQTIQAFFKEHEADDLDYCIEEDIDSDYLTVRITDTRYTFDERFVLARTLNRQAVREDACFSVIASFDK